MAKLYFRYGAMNSGKTARLLMVADNYLKQGKRVVILKPDKDTRWDMQGEIRSRAIQDALMGYIITDEHDLLDFIEKLHCPKNDVDVVLVEEAQFLNAAQVRQLALVVDKLEIPVLCYGLRCSYVDGDLFEGSRALMYWADSIEEVKNVCQYCKAKATKNLLRINGVPQYSGNNVVIGDIIGTELVYTPVCLRHYLNPPPL